jgi:hypothetical protein
MLLLAGRHGVIKTLPAKESNSPGTPIVEFTQGRSRSSSYAAGSLNKFNILSDAL